MVVLLILTEYVNDKLGKWLSKSLGWKVSLGSAIVPNWRDGRITLKDVSLDLGDLNDEADAPDYEVPVPLNENYTRFSVQLDRLDVRISLRRWLEGRGWLEEVSIDGARGTLDKRWVRAIEGWKWPNRKGDFDLESLHLRNVHLSIIQPRGFRPYSVTILSAHVPRLRAAWLFYDLMSAESAHGIFDGRSLFTLHTTESTDRDSVHRRQLKHFRMLGLDVRHLSQGSGDNALGWVTRGTVDIEGFYQLPEGEESKTRAADGESSLTFTPDTLKEKLLIPLFKREVPSSLSESEQSPLAFWYESKVRSKLPDEIVYFTDGLVTLPTRVLDRISQRKHAGYNIDNVYVFILSLSLCLFCSRTVEQFKGH